MLQFKSLRQRLLAPFIAAGVVSIAPAAAAGDIPGSFKSDSSGQLPDGVKPSGNTQRTVRWTDDKGEHLAIFSIDEKVKKKKDNEDLITRGLYVDIFTARRGKFTKVRTVREIVAACPFDNTNAFRETSVGVTDLDQNGIGELTFMYAHGYRSDVSPLGLKLIMLEGAKKYALRGTTRLNPGDGFIGGEYEADFKKAPPAFLPHAEHVWKKHMNE
jgi:hypothetical protein